MPVNGFSYTLSWSDFSKLPVRPNGQKEDAQIHPEMAFSNFQLARKGKSVTIKDLDIDISLVAIDCWVVDSAMSSELLNHEQGHYDILALSAREFYNSLKGLSSKSVHDLQEEVTRKQKAFARKVKKVDDRYDVKTNHSRDKQEQKNWDQKILAEKNKPDGSIDNLPS